jgi:O-antigen/teichoic acid export membrane protein
MKDIVVATVKFGGGQVMALLCGAITVKVMAMFAGPAGVGLFSLLRQAQQTLTALATLGGQNAVVQGVSSRVAGDRDRFIVSVLWALIASALAVAGAAVALGQPLASLIFPADEASGPALMRWLALPVVAGALLVYFRSLLNAHMWIGTVAWVNVVTAATSVVLVYPAIVAYQGGTRLPWSCYSAVRWVRGCCSRPRWRGSAAA